MCRRGLCDQFIIRGELCLQHRHRYKYRYIFDIDALLRSIILFGFMGLLLWLIHTNQLTLYINPKFSVLVETAGYLLFPLGVAQMLSIIQPIPFLNSPHRHNHASRLLYLPFIAILALAFLLPNNTLNANLVNNKGLNSQLTAPAPGYELPRPLAAKLRRYSLIEVTDRDYAEIINELQFFSQEYLGKEITMTGFVFRPPGITKNQFSLVRYVIVCCTADALPYGVLCECKNGEKFKDGTWLSIKGVIQQSNYEDKVVPAIKITSLKQVKEPQTPYVFPPNQ
ncbi:MAG: TIGR03943 family protein [Veillonellales bacterium]